MVDRSACRVNGFVWSVALACAGIGGGVAAGQDAEGLSSRFRQASKAALPAVVTVRPAGVVAPSGGGIDIAALANRSGSGVVVDAARGLIVTNDHVIAGASQGVVVILANGRERAVGQVWRDPKSDLAVLAVDPSGLLAAPWGDDRRLDIGDWVLAIGGPFGLSGTVTAGIVSGKSRGIGVALYEDLIQTDAAINPGNSGGPLINLQGEVIGISTALKSSGGGFEGVGFAIPASRARRVVAELVEFGRVRRAYLGITVRPLDAATAARLNIAEGTVVASVIVASPAAQAGIRPGDVILQVNGRPAGPAGTLQGAIEVARVGEPIELTVDRNGQVFPVPVRPEPQPDQYGLPAVVPTAAVAPIVPGPVEAFAVPRRRGLRINVPGLDMVVPGPNLDVTPFGVSRPRREVVVAPPVVVEPASVLVPPADPPAVVSAPTNSAPPPNPADPILTPIPADSTPAEPTLTPPTSVPPPVPAPVAAASRPGAFPALGLDLADPTPALAEKYRLPRDASGPVIIKVADDGPADRGGLEPGMLLTDAAGRLVGNVADFRRAVADRPAGRDLLVRIRRGSKAEFRVVVAPAAEPVPTPTSPPAPAAPPGESTLDPLPPAGSRPL